MSLRRLAYIGLPPHQGQGGFDHAAVHTRLGLLYVAHTANDALDVIDCAKDQYLRSIPKDPFTQSASAWVPVPPQDTRKGNVWDVKSAAKGYERY